MRFLIPLLFILLTGQYSPDQASVLDRWQGQFNGDITVKVVEEIRPFDGRYIVLGQHNSDGILIKSSLHGEAFEYVLIHELLHWKLPGLSERQINKTTEDLIDWRNNLL